MRIMDERVAKNLIKFKPLIKVENYGFLHTLQLDTREALGVGFVLNEAGLKPFSNATQPEVKWAIQAARKWFSYKGPTLFYDLNSELDKSSSYRSLSAANIAPIMAALNCVVYECVSDTTGEVNWLIAPTTYQDQQLILRTLERLQENGWFTEYTGFTQIDKYGRHI